MLKHQANNFTEENQLKNPDPLQAEKELEKYLTCTQEKTLPWSAEVLPLKKTGYISFTKQRCLESNMENIVKIRETVTYISIWRKQTCQV